MTLNNKALAELQKNYSGTLLKGNIPELKRLSTGLPNVDWCLGGGLGVGRINMIYAESSQGKSLFAMHCIKAAQEQGLTCALIDMEKTIDSQRLLQLGVNESELYFAQPDVGDDALALIEELAKAEVDLIVLDSIAACMPRVMMDTEADEFANKQFIGNQARMFATWMPRIQTNLNKYSSTLLAINQTRTKISTFGYGEPITLVGGKAVVFYSSIIMKIKTKYSGKGDGYGESEYTTTKNKTAVNGRKATVKVSTGGLNVQHAEMEVLVNADFKVFKIESGGMYYLSQELLNSGYVNEYISNLDMTKAYARGRQACIDRLDTMLEFKHACLNFIRNYMSDVAVESASVPVDQLDIIDE
jgi:recombination protein RecA